MQGNGAKVSLYPLARFVGAMWSSPSGGAPRKLPVGLMDVCLSLASHQLSHLPLLAVGCNLLSPKPSISPCSCLRPPGALDRSASDSSRCRRFLHFLFSFSSLMPHSSSMFYSSLPVFTHSCIQSQTYHENSGGEPKYQYFSKLSRLTFLCRQSL